MAKEGLGIEITELRLGLPGGGLDTLVEKTDKKRVFSEIFGDGISSGTYDRKSKTKSQVVGWPPVCSYRKRNGFHEKDDQRQKTLKMYVKVSMDGAPFLRKIDLSMHKGYYDFTVALEKLFDCFGICNSLRGADSCEQVPIYEDKDGDWMLVGDVPWEMFIDSCKRLRIMKRSDSKGFGVLIMQSPKAGFPKGV